MLFDRFSRSLPILAVIVSLAGCVTIAPEASPTAPPTLAPTATPAPTPPPTAPPTPAPTAAPTPAPTAAPTLPPTAPPTDAPTIPPTDAPTDPPTTDRLDPNLDARYGSPAIVSGFTDDPKSESVYSGGPIDVSYLGDNCTGYAEPNPDYEIQYTAGSMSMLRIYFIADSPGQDATLIINDAANSWHCSDDEYGTSNPSIEFSPPEGGVYDIWIGSYSPTDYISGTLYITELSYNHP